MVKVSHIPKIKSLSLLEGTFLEGIIMTSCRMGTYLGGKIMPFCRMGTH